MASLNSARAWRGKCPLVRTGGTGREQHLKAMAKYLGGLKTYTFQVEEFFDSVQDDGQKLQFSNQRRLSVSRPDKVFGEAEGDTEVMLDLLNAFWSAVNEVFKDAWGKPPRKSRLMHGAGVMSLGFVMDAIGDGIDRPAGKHRSADLSVPG